MKSNRDKIRDVLAPVVFIIAFLAVWQIVSETKVFNESMFPSLTKIGGSLSKGFTEDKLLSYTLYSLGFIGKGLLAGVVLAFVFSSLTRVSKIFYSIYNMIVSVFDLLPGVALLPLAILWFGIGEWTVLVIVVHGIIWPMSRNILDGFNSVPKLMIESGKNMGLTGLKLVLGVYIPASFASILSGLRVGWARAWRGLIAIEMIFGTTGSGAGIGWFIFMKRTNFDIAGVFAALIVIMGIGIIMEYGIFSTIERNTIRKWGMVR